MQKTDLDNADPTVLSVSQLPSRSQKRSPPRSGPDSKFDHVVFQNKTWPWAVSDQDDDDLDDTDYAEDPIDEQEIYGKPPAPVRSIRARSRLPCFMSATAMELRPLARPPRVFSGLLFSSCLPAITPLMPHRPDLHHIRSRTSSHPRPAVCRQASRHPHHTVTDRAAGPTGTEDSASRAHPDHQPLLSGHRHWPRGASQAREGLAAQLPGRCPHEGGVSRFRRASKQAAGRQGESRRGP